MSAIEKRGAVNANKQRDLAIEILALAKRILPNLHLDGTDVEQVQPDHMLFQKLESVLTGFCTFVRDSDRFYEEKREFVFQLVGVYKRNQEYGKLLEFLIKVDKADKHNDYFGKVRGKIDYSELAFDACNDALARAKPKDALDMELSGLIHRRYLLRGSAESVSESFFRTVSVTCDLCVFDELPRLYVALKQIRDNASITDRELVNRLLYIADAYERVGSDARVKKIHAICDAIHKRDQDDLATLAKEIERDVILALSFLSSTYRSKFLGPIIKLIANRGYGDMFLMRSRPSTEAPTMEKPKNSGGLGAAERWEDTFGGTFKIDVPRARYFMRE